MSVDFAGIVATLQRYNPSIAGLVVTSVSGEIYYCTPNWQPDPNDVKKVVAAWRGGNAVSVMLQGVKFSCLQANSERFIATNIKKQGHLVGAMTPSQMCVLAFVLPDSAYDGAYMDVSRAAAQMRPGGSAANMSSVVAATAGQVYVKTDSAVSQAKLANSGGARPQASAGGGAVAGNPDVQEIQQLLQWIQNPSNSLAQYIQYCLQNNDAARVGAFARFYRALRQILG
jgi:hypothetical protein